MITEGATMTLEEFDENRDRQLMLAQERAYELSCAFATIEREAILSAMMTHPITRFVQRVPAASTMYPAISGGYVNLTYAITHKRTRTAPRSADQNHQRPNMVWSLPGQSRSPGCGVFRTNGALPVKMCVDDPKHFMKAVSNHCGSIRCRNCMNYVSMMAGVTIEDRICTPADIAGRKSGFYDKPRHWAVSPPQDWMKRIAQRSDTFSGLVDDLCRLLPLYGMYAGAIVFHPWRLSEDASLWEFSPHFHVVGYGKLDNMRLRADLAKVDDLLGIWGDDGRSESWVLNQIHPDEDIESVRHTFGYILTHVGIGSFDFDNDWIDDADRISIPVERASGTSERAKTLPPSVEYGDNWKFYRYYAEHLDQFDFVEWSKKCCTSQVPTYRVFGSVTRVRTVSDYKERMPRMCPECGQPVGRFEGVHSLTYETVMYDRSSKIRAMRDDVGTVSEVFSDLSEDARNQGRTLLDLAMAVPQCSTPETKGLQDLEHLRTPDERVSALDRVVAYVPSVHYKSGFDPVVLTRRQYDAWRRTGLLPSNVVVPDPIRTTPEKSAQNV